MKHIVIIGWLLWAVAATAAETYPGGRWLVGIDGQSVVIESGESHSSVEYDDRAAGTGFQVGRMMTPNLLLRLHATGSERPTDVPDVKVMFAGGSLELVYVFREVQEFRPYFGGGIGGYVLELERELEDRTVDTTGPAMSVCVGFFQRLSERFALHAQARVEAINWRYVYDRWDRPGEGSGQTETWIEDSGYAGTASLGAVFRF